MSAANVALARRFFKELWNERRAEVASEIIAEHGTCQSEAGEIRGVGAFIQGSYEPFTAAFPDLRITIEGTVAENDQVVVRWRASGTHSGPGFGVEPSGRRIR